MTQDEASRLGEYIRRERERQGLSIRGLAEDSGISAANLLRIENGKIREPSPHSLQRIARQLGRDYEDLAALAGYTLPDGLPTLPVFLRTTYDDLTSEEIRQVEAYVQFLRHQHGGDDDGQPAE